MILAVIMAVTLAACGSNGGTSPDSSETPPADSGSASAGSGSAPAASDEVDKSDWVKLDLNASSYLPPNDTIQWLQGNYTEGLENALGDYVEITWHNSGTLVPAEGTVDALRAGMCDIGFVDLPLFSDQFPVSNAWCLPGLGSGSSPGGSAAFTEWAQTNQWDLPEYDDFIFLSGQSNGPMVFLTTYPVNSPADIKGKQLRSTATIANTLKAFGATPVVMPAGETYEALRNGMVQGEYASFGGMMLFGNGDFCTHSLSLDINSEVYAYLLSKDLFEQMPPSQQEAFLAGWYDGYYNSIIPEWEKYMVAEALPITDGAKNVTWTFEPLGTEISNEFAKLGEPVLRDYIANLEKDGVDGDKLVADIKASQKKWIDDWWTYEREYELYRACAGGTFEEFMANYTTPPNMPTPNPAVIKLG
jgi:TRAP-type C4-dicarboxylate transport system substrate-binding protein